MPKQYIIEKANSLEFFRYSYRLMLKIALVLLVLILGAIGVLFYQHFTEAKLQYFATTSSGHVIELNPQER